IELWAERLGAPGAAHDALTYRVLIWAMEAASLELLNASDPLELPRVKRVLGDLLVGTLCPRTQAPTRLQG
ncbi:TetR/AcrR family transcriptional regulator, partial [Pseudomonas aeruginosa]|nr:TetR/AcrR family transcriptional regulator [Pseudomonas aeruginosa]